MKRLVLIASFALSALSVGACGTDNPDPVQESCQRLDTCNALNTGISVDECVQDVDKSLDGLTADNRKDWDTLMKNCLSLASCETFLSCVQQSGL